MSDNMRASSNIRALKRSSIEFKKYRLNLPKQNRLTETMRKKEKLMLKMVNLI